MMKKFEVKDRVILGMSVSILSEQFNELQSHLVVTFHSEIIILPHNAHNKVQTWLRSVLCSVFKFQDLI
jgi:hypothetical protein